MVPIKETVSSNAWFDCRSKDEIRFKMRILLFEKVNLAEVDDPDKVKIDSSNGNYWILKIEIMNLTKRKISPDDAKRVIILVDQDEFHFNCVEDRHLSYHSDYATTSGLKRLYSDDLIPKIKMVGAITFFLPDDDEAEYSLTIDKGNIEEA